MSHNSRNQCNETSNNLSPLDGHLDTIVPDGSDPSHVVFQADVDCTICTFLSRPLDCCQTRTSSHPCPKCAELSQLFTREIEKHKDKLAALRDKLRQTEEEPSEEKLTRLCAEASAKIDELEREVEKMNKEDELLKAESKELGKTLKRLEADIEKAQPVAGYMIKEKKKGKRSSVWRSL